MRKVAKMKSENNLTEDSLPENALKRDDSTTSRNGLVTIEENDNIDALLFAPSFFRSALNYLLVFTRGENFKTSVILFYAVIALTLWKYIPSAPQFADPVAGKVVLAVGDDSLVRPLDGSLRVSLGLFFWDSRKIWAAFLLMGIGPALVVKFVFKEKLADYGLFLKDPKRFVRSTLSFLPIFIILGWLSGYTRAFYGVYPFNPLAGASWGALIAHTLLYLFLYYVSWEFMFRGFIQIGLSKTLGLVPAVLVQIGASTMLHYGHPASETLGCILGGFFWGYLVFRTKSLWSGCLQHATLGIALDWSLVLNAC